MATGCDLELLKEIFKETIVGEGCIELKYCEWCGNLFDIEAMVMVAPGSPCCTGCRETAEEESNTRPNVEY